MDKLTLYFFVGTTAELIKLAPVIRECKKRKIKTVLVSSGQNIVDLKDFKSIIGQGNWDISLCKKSVKPSVFKFVLWVLKSFVETIKTFYNEFFKNNPGKKIVIVHGDTVSAVIGAFVGYIYRVPVAHVESGLRSFKMFEPFPEEINRILVSFFATIHFCPNNWSLNNLRRKSGIKVNTFNNTLVETVKWCLSQKLKYKLPLKKNSKYFVLIVHRQENVIFNKCRTINLIKYIIDNTPAGLSCVFVLHSVTQRYLGDSDFFNTVAKSRDVLFLPRMKMPDFVHIVRNSEFVITDGGSNQEEMYYLGKPCLILRNVTERIEGLKSNVVLSKYNKRIIGYFLRNYTKYKTNPVLDISSSPSKIIIDEILNLCKVH
ncbi:MAG: UDP-N-acetylglucosamine 2-epimerase [Patescibacteria group bacterium]|nr:UDP-N-acetylglucosamine 2-epimerase [Patescibacteria group bacterium]